MIVVDMGQCQQLLLERLMVQNSGREWCVDSGWHWSEMVLHNDG